MDKLSRSGTRAYYEATRQAFFIGIISWEQVLHRMSFLQLLIDDTALKKKLLFLTEEQEEKEELPRDDIDGIEILTEPFDSPGDEVSYSSCSFHELPTIQLIVTGIAGMNRWVFHKYDRDFFPSVPHGHENGCSRKLDPYLEWVYKMTAQIARENRKTIIALWNNEPFRIYASESIRWFTTEYPRFKWRVQNPHKIPRKR